MKRTALIIIVAWAGACSEPAREAAESEPAAATYTRTRHPIVLMPGILGFDKLLGVVEYFPAIPEALAADGAQVFIVYGSQVSSSRVRVDQIVPQLEDIKAITGAARLNLIGHSQGAVDARVIAAERPDLVASVTSVGGPHRGAPLADRVLDGSLTPLAPFALQALGDFFTLLVGSTDANDVRASMHSLSTQGMAELNARYPAALPASPCGQGAAEVGGIRYWSWGGVGSLTNPLDLLDPVWVMGSLAGREENDGMVGRCSSHLGVVIRDNYAQNHIDETNMLFGLVLPLGPRPPALYRAQASRLQLAGL